MTFDSSIGQYVYTDEDGTKHYFTYDSATGTYKDEYGADITLVKNGDNSYTIKDKGDNTLIFTPTGYLNLIKDSNGNKATLAYDGVWLKTVPPAAAVIQPRLHTLEVKALRLPRRTPWTGNLFHSYFILQKGRHIPSLHM